MTLMPPAGQLTPGGSVTTVTLVPSRPGLPLQTKKTSLSYLLLMTMILTPPAGQFTPGGSRTTMT